jgi:hypothetical protein
MPSARFKPTIPATEWQQEAYALDCKTNVFGLNIIR